MSSLGPLGGVPAISAAARLVRSSGDINQTSQNQATGAQASLRNQQALNTRAVPFAHYINAMHQRIHRVFADLFLPSLDQLPKSDPLNDYSMHADIEIVLSQDDGRISGMGIVHSSGVAAFDVSALESIQRAAPFGKPPGEIVSPDGYVYMHWDLHRNPDYACSTWFAYPRILRDQSGH